MLDREEVSRLVRDEFVEIDQAVEKDAHLRYVLSQLLHCEVPLCWGWLYHVIHLAEQVDEKNRLVVQVLQPMHLFLVEVVHFMRRDDTILVQVDDFIPVLERAQRRLVFLVQHEPDEVFVAHLTFLTRLELARHLREYAINGLARKSVTLIPREVFLIDQEVVVSVQLPKPAIKHVEVLVAEVLAYFVDVLFCADVMQHSEQIRVLKVPERDVPIIVRV